MEKNLFCFVMNFLIKVITVKKKLTKKFIVLSPSIFSSLFVKNNKHNHLTLKIVIKKEKKKPISEYRGIFFIINKNITSGDCGRIKKGYYNVVYFCIAIYRV